MKVRRAAPGQITWYTTGEWIEGGVTIRWNRLTYLLSLLFLGIFIRHIIIFIVFRLLGRSARQPCGWSETCFFGYWEGVDPSFWACLRLYYYIIFVYILYLYLYLLLSGSHGTSWECQSDLGEDAADGGVRGRVGKLGGTHMFYMVLYEYLYEYLGCIFIWIFRMWS